LKSSVKFNDIDLKFLNSYSFRHYDIESIKNLLLVFPDHGRQLPCLRRAPGQWLGQFRLVRSFHTSRHGWLIGSGARSSTPPSSGGRQYTQYVTAILQLSHMNYDIPSVISPFVARWDNSLIILYNVSVTVSDHVYYKNIAVTPFRPMYSFTVSPSLSNGSYTLSIFVFPLSGQDFFSVGGAHF